MTGMITASEPNTSRSIGRTQEDLFSNNEDKSGWRNGQSLSNQGSQGKN